MGETGVVFFVSSSASFSENLESDERMHVTKVTARHCWRKSRCWWCLVAFVVGLSFSPLLEEVVSKKILQSSKTSDTNDDKPLNPIHQMFFKDSFLDLVTIKYKEAVDIRKHHPAESYHKASAEVANNSLLWYRVWLLNPFILWMNDAIWIRCIHDNRGTGFLG